MGVEILMLAVSAASAINTVRNQRTEASAQREAGKINTATGEAENIAARRRAAREARIRRGRLRAAAANSGTTGSSGELGASGALTSNLGGAVAAQRSGELSARGLSAANQRAADARSNTAIFNAYAGVAVQGLTVVQGARNNRAPTTS